MTEAATKTRPGAGLEFVPLTPDRLDDLAVLFDQPGDPRWCWCAAFHIDGRVKARPRDENRAVLTERAVTGPSPGLLAYRGDRVVGWVSVSPRDSYRKLRGRAADDDMAPAPVWAIVCFVVDRRERGAGLARSLLAAAIDHARAAGAASIEAYAIDPGPERIPSPVAYSGTIGMFLEAGFAVVGERRPGTTRWSRPIVRLDLGRDE